MNGFLDNGGEPHRQASFFKDNPIFPTPETAVVLEFTH